MVSMGYETYEEEKAYNQNYESSCRVSAAYHVKERGYQSAPDSPRNSRSAPWDNHSHTQG